MNVPALEFAGGAGVCCELVALGGGNRAGMEKAGGIAWCCGV